MGTSLSGLTPATTFDGLLKVGDNDPLTATLKPISTGDGTDTMLELSTSALQIGGATGMYWDNTNKRLGIGTDSPQTPLQVNGAIRSSGSGTQIFEFSSASLAQFRAIFGSVGFRLGSGMFIGGTDGGPASSTRLHIKGSGATSATTSLLVQNSAGGNVFSVRDDGALLFYRSSNSAELLRVDDTGTSPRLVSGNNAGKSLTLGNDTILSSYSSIQFKTHDGSAYSEAMRITGNTNQFVGIGETTPTARLHIKGSGNDANTIALRVQNSAGTDTLIIGDDGFFKVRGGAGVSNLIRTNTTNNNVGIGLATPDSASRMHIQGKGATSATTALLVQNSAGTDTLEVRDDGQINFNGNIYANADYKSIGRNSSNSIRFAGGETRVAVQGSSSGHRFHIYSSSTATSLFSVYTQTQQVGIGNGNTALDGSAKLQVDSTTQGFLPPRMADSERDAITSPATGLMIYDTTNNQMNYFNGSNWVAF